VVLTVARRRLTGGLPSSVSGTILLTILLGACKPLSYGTRLRSQPCKAELTQHTSCPSDPRYIYELRVQFTHSFITMPDDSNEKIQEAQLLQPACSIALNNSPGHSRSRIGLIKDIENILSVKVWVWFPIHIPSTMALSCILSEISEVLVENCDFLVPPARPAFNTPVREFPSE